ncbi:S-layer homology domain-containing protein [Paenibacillus spiritus]|uniref:S-layer homology domain-containing protein n=1 Tax=Paenibacillus spiritus TaxID=2496557 RepID=A0A5J5G9B5_9BACL|nr:S-layer homology domain-containing protein [Paenibacillus spiritus]KAA9004124.1 S-layer homology domain-containing protein [Paenibacillus spiritus]
MTEVTTTDDFDQAQALGNPVVQQIAKAVYSQLAADNAADEGRPVTRAEFTSLLARELGLKASPQGKTFSDVAPASLFYDDIRAAREAGIIYGWSDNSFKGDTILTRAEMTTMFIRAYELLHGTVNTELAELSYKDRSEVPSWAQASMLKASFLNKISRYADGTYQPSGATNYADAIGILSGLWTVSKATNDSKSN